MEYEDHGHGPAVVLLHGQPGRGHDWSAVVSLLGGSARVLVPDRPGYGRSAGPAVGVSANADAVIAMLDGVGVADGAIVAGHSWGGAVALDLARRYPARVRALVLAGSVGGPGSIDGFDRVLGLPVLGPALSLSALSALRLVATVRTPRVRRLVVPNAPELVEHLSLDLWRDWHSFVVEQRAMLAELPPIAADLARIAAPATVLAGSNDRVVSPASQERLAAALPAGRLVRLKGIGHLVPLEAPGVVADAVLTALAGTL